MTTNETALREALADLLADLHPHSETEGWCDNLKDNFRVRLGAIRRAKTLLQSPSDVMIGNFIAQYDEGAAGCMMDADDAQALAREFKRMQGLIYCPGVLRCAKCDFRLIKTKLTPSGAFANEEPDRCPNCDVPMWRVTWKDEAHDAYKTAESQMDRALEAERKLAHPQASPPPVQE